MLKFNWKKIVKYVLQFWPELDLKVRSSWIEDLVYP